ncbi:LOW QUALITY PROTEIN: mothers against decapentaplegic homolog 6-like [Gavia stellata]|uniref:LOW QUALITY PROTEIN: mothers against decapentaplegic homolog 6-like n=1 Tax=Gavia stellata TaxID=37040 RepID=UPI002899765A|nr:LOW QUALITY PROTEIN: mothers against decapentaplegic homolog 6-like [Gavia stellata]
MRPAGTGAAKSRREAAGAKRPQRAQPGWSCGKGHGRRDAWGTRATPGGWLWVPQQAEPPVLRCCLCRISAGACPRRRGSSARPGLGGSAWRQRSLPYLGGKSGAGSAVRRGIRVPFTLALCCGAGSHPCPAPAGGALATAGSGSPRNMVLAPEPTHLAPAPLLPRLGPGGGSALGLAGMGRINEFPKRGGPGEGRSVPAQEKVLAAARRRQSGAGRPKSVAPCAAPHPPGAGVDACPRPAGHPRRPMFRSRRAGLVRRLWRQRCAAAGPEDGPGALKPAAHALFKKLKDEELELLVQAVESRGAWESGCVWVPRGEPRGAKQALPPQVLLCRLYRWPDLRQPHELKHLCYCAGGRGGCGDAAVLCCNPHHFSRLAAPETPPPPYSKASCGPSWPDEPQHPGTQLLEFSYNGGDWRDTSLSWSTVKDGYWCKLAYWEHRTRVGRLYAVHEASVNIFCELPRGSGFCLGQLPAAHRSRAVRRARGKIGRGLLLSREPGGVWAYNRSEHPIFVSSPTLGPPGARGLTVLKVLPGYSAKVFDYERVGGTGGRRLPGEGPCDPHSVRISFAKGWGPCYSRQFITSCPCWLEVLLNQPR